MPGTAVATTSSAPSCTSRFEMRRRPRSSRYSSSAWSGVSVRARTPGPHARTSSYSSGGRPEHGREPRFAFDLDDQHARARAGGSRGERSGDRRLPDAALARHDDDPGGGAELAGAPSTACYEARPRRTVGAVVGSAARWPCVLAVQRRTSRSIAGGERPGRRRDPMASDGDRHRSCRSKACSTRRTSTLLRDAIEPARTTSAARCCCSSSTPRAPSSTLRPSCARSAALACAVVVWVGPSGAEARGGAALLVEAAAHAVVRSARAGIADGRSGAATTRSRARDVRDWLVVGDGDGAARSRNHSPADAATLGRDRRVRPTIGEVIVDARRHDRAHRRRRRQALDREGDRRGPRPSSPAEPGRRVRQPRTRRADPALR